MTAVIQFSQISDISPAVDYLSDAISRALIDGKRVLWLISGGSCIEVAVAISKRLADIPLEKLTVTLTDERYGEIGHKDSNWAQLIHAGFELPGAKLKPVLYGSNLETSVKTFAQNLENDLQAVNYRVGLFGIGPDGHTSGILPNTPAVSATGLAYGYETDQYSRITTTTAAIRKLDEVVVYAVGQPKWQVIDQLETGLPINDQPAQILKQVPKLIIFNDHKGEQI